MEDLPQKLLALSWIFTDDPSPIPCLFTLTGHAVYAKKDRSDKVEYLGLWNANVHHIVVCIMVVYFAKNSQCENAYDYMFLFDPVCAYTVDYGVVTPVLFTSAYLSYDFVLHFTLVENRGPMYL